jgi:GxxExxY protein
MTTTSLPLISTDHPGFIHSELPEKIIGVLDEVYNELGHGFLESVYEQALLIQFAQHETFFQRQTAVPVLFRGHQIGDFRSDRLIENKVIVRLKAGRAIETAWEKQLLNDLRATQIEVGLLLNFGSVPPFRRPVFDDERKRVRVHPQKSADEKLPDAEEKVESEE